MARLPGRMSGLQLPQAAAVSRIAEVPLYSVDPLVRGKTMQETQRAVEGDLAVLRLNPSFAASLGFIKKGIRSLSVRMTWLCP